MAISVVHLRINGVFRHVPVTPTDTLLSVLRDRLGLTGTKRGCGEGECGACTVLLNGEAVCSCLIPAAEAEGADVITIEGLAADGGLHPIQQAFVDEEAMQCGYCTPGMVLAAKALLDRVPDPSEGQIRAALCGNLCRCTGYTQIVSAVKRAAAALRGQPPETATSPDGGVVGRPVERIGARDKVTGRTLYAGDIELPGLLHAAVVHSPHAHAEIEAINAEEALALNGVRAVLTAADLPDVRFGLLAADEPLLACDRVRYVGERVALVAAVDLETALEAARRVQVRYRPLPAVLSVEEAVRDGSPEVHPGVDEVPGGAFGMALAPEGNRCYEEEVADGDLDAAFEQADVVLEGTYRTAPQHQASIEPHVAVAAPSGDGGVAVWTSTQAPFLMRQGVCVYLGLPMSKVRVIAMETGGAFGGKVSMFMEPMVAALALRTGQPVRLVYSRQQELDDGRPRCATVIRVRTAAKADGTLLGREVDFLADSGAYADWTPAVINASLRGTRGPYRVPALRAKGCAAYTHKFNTGAFRAPGFPQLTFALESHMDELAGKLGVSPVELRRKNLLRNGEKTFSGTEIKTDVFMRCFDVATKAMADDPAGEPHSAWGLACGEWETGGHPASALLKVSEDGTVSLSVGSTDLTGSLTAIAQVVADELGIEMDQLSASCIDTDTSPLAPLSGGSMVTYNMTNVAREGAKRLADELKKRATAALEAKPSQMEVTGLAVRLKKDPSKSVSFAGLVANEPAGITITTAPLPATHSFAVHAVKVSVSPETGEVRVLRAISALDCGKAINPNMVKGQMCGGLVQGLGEGLWEEIRFDSEGRVANIGFGDYRLPTAADVPEIECHIVEGEVSTSQGHGCKGVGEPVHVPAFAAAANAVCAAIGRRIYESPLSPERILGT